MNHTTPKLLFTFFLLLINFLNQAQTWTGSVNSNWDLPENWSPAEVPSNSGHVVVPGTGVSNWPVLSSDIMISSITLQNGSQIDVKGHQINSFVGNYQSYTFLFEGSTINNTQPGTEIIIGSFSGGNVLIENCTFNGNTQLSLGGNVYSRFAADYLTIKSNHFLGNTKVIENYQTAINIGSSIDGNNQVLHGGLVFDGNLEFERTWSGASDVFNRSGATINGNFLYRNLAGTIYNDPVFGAFDWSASIGMAGTQPYTKTTISGNVDIIVNGSLTLTDNISYEGIGKITFVGGNSGYLNYIGSNSYNYNMSMEKTGSGKMSLDTPISLSGQLSFTKGSIQSSVTNPITFLDGSVYSGASDASHIIGPVHKRGNDAFTFPVGSGTKLTPVSISAPTSDTDEFSAEYINANTHNPTSKASSLTNVYSGGSWEIKRVAGNSNVSVSLGYNVPTGYITDQSKLRIAHWNGSMWEDMGNGRTTGSLVVGTVSTSSAVTSFSPFTIASADASNPLPVKLAKFSVRKENTTVVLQWNTTEEVNSDRFEVQHSKDAKSWQKIGEVNANNKAHQYQFTHITPLSAINYYRLKMIDIDGTFAHSKIESAQFASKTQTTMYPNPVSDKLFIETINGLTAMKAELLSISGINVFSASATELKSGMDLSRLSNGMYLLNITLSNGQKETHKVFVNR